VQARTTSRPTDPPDGGAADVRASATTVTDADDDGQR